MLSKEELKDIEGRAEAATQENWYVTVTGEGVPCVNCSTLDDYHGHSICIQGEIKSAANMHFIACANSDIPALLAHIRECEAKLEHGD